MFTFFFFNDTATTEIYTLSLPDALPISRRAGGGSPPSARCCRSSSAWPKRSEEHTSELQSRPHLVCRLLLEKKKITEDSDVCCTQTHLKPKVVLALQSPPRIESP